MDLLHFLQKPELLISQQFGFLLWSMAESNRRPRDCQSRALAN